MVNHVLDEHPKWYLAQVRGNEAGCLRFMTLKSTCTQSSIAFARKGSDPKRNLLQ